MYSKYYVSGKITDEQGKPIAGALVSDLKSGVAADSDGEYNFETSEKTLYVKIIGFKDGVIDLTKYPEDSSVRANVTLKENSEIGTSKTTLDISDKKSYRKYWSGAITGVILGTTGYFVSKKFSNNIYVVIGSSVLGLGLGYALGFTLVSNTVSNIKQKKADKALAKK
jgi:hypothetical protein